jgi:anti-sigma-K factor RskA
LVIAERHPAHRARVEAHVAYERSALHLDAAAPRPRVETFPDAGVWTSRAVWKQRSVGVALVAVLLVDDD